MNHLLNHIPSQVFTKSIVVAMLRISVYCLL